MLLKNLHRHKIGLARFFTMVIITIFSMQLANAQEINWMNTKNWKLYDIHGQAGMRYTLDTLKYFKSILLDKDTMQMFCNQITAWPKEDYSVWMGLYVATCETEEKKLKKIVISTYGGFFYDPESKRYYQVPADMTSDWLEFFNDSSKRIDVTN